MKERPILFSSPMVQALIAGRKTQTRRVVKPQPHAVTDVCASSPSATFLDVRDGVRNPVRCPYGTPGDLLWVRETWAAPHAYDHLPPRMIPKEATVHYSATEERGGLLWRPSIHMPRWASRLTLRITDVRVERLHEITPADAEAEGLWYSTEGDDAGFWFAGPDRQPKDVWGDGSVECYMRLWVSINGAGSWDANPWVWVLSFDVLHKNVDEVIQEAA